MDGLVDALAHGVLWQDCILLVGVFDLNHHVQTHGHLLDGVNIAAQVHKCLDLLTWSVRALEHDDL